MANRCLPLPTASQAMRLRERETWRVCAEANALILVYTAYPSTARCPEITVAVPCRGVGPLSVRSPPGADDVRG